jgi:hypothetical protein
MKPLGFPVSGLLVRGRCSLRLLHRSLSLPLGLLGLPEGSRLSARGTPGGLGVVPGRDLVLVMDLSEDASSP